MHLRTAAARSRQHGYLCRRCTACAMSAGPSAPRSSSSRASSSGMTPSLYPVRSGPIGAQGVHPGHLHSATAMSPPMHSPSDPKGAFSMRSANAECLSGMDMVGELFQQQAKRLEAQLYQQLRDQAEIERVQNQLAAASQQLKRLQVQNIELRRLVEANELTIRSTYSHARSVQQAWNGLLHVCDTLYEDAALLRQALREECPGRAHDFADVPRPALPPKLPQLPPLEGLLPPRGLGSENKLSTSHHMETALALLSTVASHKAESGAAQTDHVGDNGGSDSGSADHDSNQGSNGSHQGSSNTGTEDTVLVNSTGHSNGNGSSHSKESLDEADSGDGNGSSHGSDSGDGNAHAESNGSTGSNGVGGECNRVKKGSSNGDSDSNGTESLPIGDGSAGMSASRSDSNSSSPAHELDVEPPRNQTGSKRKR
ncbi:MAG: hypothetical protein SGPRY_014154 [Prymnesium sp.]